jgi:hypothetical protein
MEEEAKTLRELGEKQEADDKAAGETHALQLGTVRRPSIALAGEDARATSNDYHRRSQRTRVGPPQMMLHRVHSRAGC